MRQWLGILVAAAASAVVACGGSKPSSSAGADANKASAHPESVLVDFYDGSHETAACSGTLLAPRVVLTAAHCADKSLRAVVRAPYANTQSSSVERVRRYDWTEDAEKPGAHPRHDVALLILKKPIHVATYATVQAESCPGCRVVHVGRESEAGAISRTDLFVGPSQHTSTTAPAGHPYSWYVAHGSSDAGGAVYRAGASRPQIVGVMSAKGGMSGGGYVTRLDTPRVQRWVREVVASTSSKMSHASGTSAKGAGGLHLTDDPPADDTSGDDSSDPPQDPVEPSEPSVDDNNPPSDPGSDPAADNSGGAPSSDSNTPPAAPSDSEPVNPGGAPPADDSTSPGNPASDNAPGAGTDTTPYARSVTIDNPDAEGLDVTRTDNYWGTSDGSDQDNELVANERALAEAAGDNLFVIGTHGDVGTVQSAPTAEEVQAAVADGRPILMSVCFAGAGNTDDGVSAAGSLADQWGVPREDIIACTGEVSPMPNATTECDGDWVDGNGNVIMPMVPGVTFRTSADNAADTGR